MRVSTGVWRWTAALTTLCFLAACSSAPSSIVIDHDAFSLDKSRLTLRYMDGLVDDLASAGLGVTGLRSAQPDIEDPSSPTDEEMRRQIIYHNFRSLVSVKAETGYGSRHGRFMLNSDGSDRKIPGHELMVPFVYDDGAVASVMVLQVPDSFAWSTPCIVAVASSGSRGVYGGIGAAGAWALSKGCAVVYSDKGTGAAFYWLGEGKATSLTGQMASVGENTLFAPQVEGEVFKRLPHRISGKHAHRARSIDKNWGRFLIAAVEASFGLINERFSKGKRLTPGNTTVIGAAISNGGGAVIMAAEQSKRGLFDGVVVGEPNIPVPAGVDYNVLDGEHTVNGSSVPFLNVAYLNALYLPCSALYHSTADVSDTYRERYRQHLVNRCEDLVARGFLEGGDLQAQSSAAREILKAYGYSEGADPLSLMFSKNFTWVGLLLNYIHSTGNYEVGEHLCGLSYAHVDDKGVPISMPVEKRHLLSAKSSGIVPGAGITIVNDKSAGGPRTLAASLDASGRFDMGLDAVMCLKEELDSPRVQAGLASLSVSGDLRGLPAVIVHGEADNVIQVRSVARPYVVLNSQVERQSNLRYYEVENAQHIDRFVHYSALENHFVPLQPYFEDSLELMFAHLTEGTAIPESRVIKTKRRTSEADTFSYSQLPAINSSNPSHVRLIKVDNGRLIYAK